MTMSPLTHATLGLQQIPTVTPGSKVPSSPLMPWPSDVQGMMPNRGYGIDIDGGGDRNVAEHWRYQTGFLYLPKTAATSSFPAFWSLAAGTTLQLWDGGQGDAATIVPTPPITPWTMSRSETDLYKGGAPVPRDFAFRIRAIGFALGRPFTVADNAAPAQVHTAAIDAYADRVLSALWDVLGVQITYPEGSCNYELGLAQFHAMPAGKVQFKNHARAGQGVGVTNMLPLRGSVWGGAKDEVDQVAINVTSPNVPLQFLEDALSELNGDLYIPVTLQAYGASYFACPPAACAVPATIDPAQLASVVGAAVDAAFAARGR